MKTIIYFTALLLTLTSVTFSQSVMNYQAGTGLSIGIGADVCADVINIDGTFTGGGTICGRTAYTLTLTVFIQGFYNPSTNIMVSDTVTAYLRSISPPFVKADSSKTLLSPSGIGSFIFFSAVNGTNYYLEVRHRNSIETWSNTGNAFVSGSLAYSFTTAANKAYGDNQIQVDITPVRFAIYSGDVNQDGIIDGTDGALIDNDAANFLSGYLPTDVNGDNFVDGSDALIADNNAANFVSVIRP